VTNTADISSARDELKISGFGSTIIPGGKLQVTMNGSRFRNPPSTLPVASFEASSFSASNNLLDNQSSGIFYQVKTPFTLDASAVTISARVGEINVQD
jgi:hypothetical protein